MTAHDRAINVVSVKDDMLDMIAKRPSGTDALYEVCNVIKTVLRHTEGFWVETRYCYKAAEIAELLIVNLDYELHENRHHPKTESKIRRYRDDAFQLASRYRQLHRDTF